ncbi:uncharacterized protein LOC131174046 [Hevea brasiliensis]|uniref:uncharacterized protein LOC131174046 n=1 Tax=Hevea brasiliensis TaxID=3981 RepID=UPI0025E76D70|nr:uncharacterized protein LOC131174046 [Hevea brasiliensis]
MDLSIHVDEEGGLEQRSKQQTSIIAEGMSRLEQSMHPTFMDDELYNAVKEGNVDNFLEASITVSKNPSLHSIFDKAGPSQNSLLHMAVNFKKEDIVEFIARHRPENIYREDMQGNTALHFAARVGILKTVQILLRYAHRRQELVRKKNNLGNTALHEAVMNRHPKVAEFLIDVDQEVWYCENKEGWSPLCMAIKTGNNQILCLLLEKQPQEARYGYKLSSLQGKSPAHVAINEKKLGISSQESQFSSFYIE